MIDYFLIDCFETLWVGSAFGYTAVYNLNVVMVLIGGFLISLTLEKKKD